MHGMMFPLHTIIVAPAHMCTRLPPQVPLLLNAKERAELNKLKDQLNEVRVRVCSGTNLILLLRL